MPDESGSDRRQQPRRRLPFVRSAVAQLEDRGHLVSVADLSRSGALLESRTHLAAAPVFELRFVLPGAFRETKLECRLVRESSSDSGSQLLAVRFEAVDPETARVIDEFVDGFREPDSPG